MKKAIYTAVLLLAGLFISCDKEQETNENPPSEITSQKRNISLVINNGNTTRVSHEEISDVVTLKWSAGDQILVESVNATLNYAYDTFTLIAGEGTISGTFSGSIPEDAVTFNVYYPVNSDESNFLLNTQKQTAAASLDHLADYDVMFASDIDATGNNISFTLEHKGIIFTLPVKNSTGEAQKIIGITLTNEKDAGTGSVFAKSLQVADGAFTLTNTPSLTLAIENGTVENDAEYKAYTLVCMEDLTALDSKSLDVIVHTEKGRHTISKTAVQFTAGTRYTLNDIEMTAANFADAIRLTGSATAGGYDLSKATPFVNNNDGTYSWTGPLKADEMKFVDDANDWGNVKFQLNNGENYAIVINDGDDEKFFITGNDFYDVNVDFNTMLISVNSNTTKTWVFPIGGATPSGWNLDQAIFGYFTDVNGDGKLFKGSLELAEGNFKFLCEADFGGLTIYASSADQDLTGEQSIVVERNGTDNQWLVTGGNEGTYDVTINLDNNTIKFEKNDVAGGLPPYGNENF